MEFIIFIVLLILLNFMVIKISNGVRKKWIVSGVIVMICSPIVFMLSGIAFGVAIESGFGGAMFGMICGVLTLINGIVFLIKGLITKKI